jgi:TRAP transporter TAXI family solute receptor
MRAIVGLLCGLLLLAAPARADSLKEQVNRGVVTVISGGVDGTYVRIAADLGAVLDQKGQRVLTVLGKGSVQNLADILYLRGIDIGIVQSDVLAFAKREKLYPGIESQIQYITKLYNEELHLLAGPGIKTVQDLAGKKVNVDVKGSGTNMTASLVLDLLKVPVDRVSFDQDLALEKLKKGEISALAYVAGKPARLFRDIKAEDHLHLLSIPLGPELLETYLPSRFTHEDYPQLVPEGDPVDTVAVGAVMAVVALRRDSERYQNVAHFVDAFFGNFNDFLKPPRHPKWKEVNLSADLPGWTRFAPAAEWLKRAAVAKAATPAVSIDPDLRRQFEAFLEQQSKSKLPAQQKDALFERFVRWQASQSQNQNQKQ